MSRSVVPKCSAGLNQNSKSEVLNALFDSRLIFKAFVLTDKDKEERRRINSGFT